MRQLYHTLKSEITEWKRCFIFMLPGQLGFAIRRRYACKYFASCPRDSEIKIGERVQIVNPHKLCVGKGVRISDHTIISAGGEVTLEDYVLIAPYCKIWSINHRFDKRDVPVVQQGWYKAPVVIGSNSWLGTGVILLPGVKLGKGCIVGAGSVVTKSMPDYAIVVGNPARVIKYR